MNKPGITIRLPDWLERFMSGPPPVFPEREDRMRLVIELSRLNVRYGSGGPFGAAVFDSCGVLIATGINMVASSQCSLLHAEVVALASAQKVLGRYDIGDGGKLQYDLFASTEPCAMCFGAIPWSGVSGLICGARDEDVRGIGFEEGAKSVDWVSYLNQRGISVVRDMLRFEAVAVLQEYAAAGGLLYNSGN
ncbi:MAG: nucleoside deaminase [Steroidobacteraceae bacterium]|nr:nucleoside deaminase [Deltaproteobacteria bacterium]